MKSVDKKGFRGIIRHMARVSKDVKSENSLPVDDLASEIVGIMKDTIDSDVDQ